MWSVENLSRKKVSELKRLAKNKDIRGYYKMRKKELVQALSTEFINEVDPTSMEKIRLLLNSNPRIFELRRIAKKMGITFKRNMKKDELMERINRSLVRHEKNVQHSNSSQTTGSSSDQKIEPGPPMIPDLPKSYNTDKLVGLPVNPSWVHFYWDYSDQTLELIKRLEKRGQSLLLRIYDITFIDFDGTNAHQVWEYDIGNGKTKKYYANVNSPNATYISEIGYLNDDGEFITILRSNSVHTPPNAFSQKKEERWLDLSSGYRFSEPAKGILAKPVLKGVGKSSFFPHEFKERRITSGGGSFFSMMRKGNSGGVE